MVLYYLVVLADYDEKEEAAPKIHVGLLPELRSSIAAVFRSQVIALLCCD